MVDTSPDLGPDVRALVQTVLTILGPLLQAGAMLLPGADAPPGRCQQAWCPVCAVMAVASGEHHPLAAIVAEYGATLLALLQSVASPTDAARAPVTEPAAPATSRYQSIPVTIHD